MKHTIQQALFDWRLRNCPFGDLIEDWDTACTWNGKANAGYDVISCDRSDLAHWLAHIGGPGFTDVTAKPTEIPRLPNYIPVITHGSGKILSGVEIPFVATQLEEIVSPKELSVKKSLAGTLGINQNTKVILLSYGRDELIENIWPERLGVFQQIKKLGFALATGINYSIWFDQPHAENVINLKRSLITFRELQKVGIPSIPHIYWAKCSQIDLIRWANWVNDNINVHLVAVNLQTLEDEELEEAIEDLGFLVGRISKPIHFLITGPTTPMEIRLLIENVPSFTLTNTAAAMCATSRVLLDSNGEKLIRQNSEKPKNEIFRSNVNFYTNLIKQYRQRHQEKSIIKSVPQPAFSSL